MFQGDVMKPHRHYGIIVASVIAGLSATALAQERTQEKQQPQA
jgi:hypothetical protein